MSPASEHATQPGAERSGRRRVLVVVLAVLVLLLGGGYAGAYAAAGDNVPHGARVAGVDIGGRSASEAAAALETGLADRMAAAITLLVDGEEFERTPAELGLSLDVEATVEAAGGGSSPDPRRLWEYYTGGEDITPVVRVDTAVLDEALDQVDAEAGSKPRNGAVSFESGTAEVTDPVVGESVDRGAAQDALTQSWLVADAEGPAPVTLDLVEAQPAIDDADVSAALADFAEPALSGPVTLVFDDTPVELTPAEYAPALRLKPVEGELEPGLDRKALVALVDAQISADEPVDATVRLVDGRPKVVPAKPGVTFKRKQVTSRFLDVVARPAGERTIDVEATVAEPDRTTAEARALKIVEKVSEFSTFYPPATYRDINIGRAAELIDGYVLEPGETFSMNDTVGERTAANGFTEGFIISNGILKEDLGGGVSQMATTLYNAAFFAGLEDVEHKAHSFYIDRYPVGREATVFFGQVDLRFKNNTPYGVLIDTEVIPGAGRSQGTVTVRMWSTEYWNIETTTGKRFNFTSPDTRRLSGPDCVPNQGYGGFDINVKRFVRRVGDPELIRTETIFTRYTPSDTVICED